MQNLISFQFKLWSLNVPVFILFGLLLQLFQWPQSNLSGFRFCNRVLSLSLYVSSIFQMRVYNNTSEHIYNRLSASFFIRKYLLSVCNKSANNTLVLLLLLGLWLCAVCLVSYLPGRLIFRFISNAHPFVLQNRKLKFSYAHTGAFLCDNNTTQRNATQHNSQEQTRLKITWNKLSHWKL